MAAPATTQTQQITLSDLYLDGLSQAQARRIVALLGLAQPQRSGEQPERKTPAA